MRRRIRFPWRMGPHTRDFWNNAIECIHCNGVWTLIILMEYKEDIKSLPTRHRCRCLIFWRTNVTIQELKETYVSATTSHGCIGSLASERMFLESRFAMVVKNHRRPSHVSRSTYEPSSSHPVKLGGRFFRFHLIA